MTVKYSPFVFAFLLLPAIIMAGGFNFKVEIPLEYHNTPPGEDVYASFSLFNLENQDRKDITIEYWVTGPEGEFGRKQETLAIETQASLVRKITVPADSSEGKASFQARILYGEGKEQLSSSTFFIKKPVHPYKRFLPLGISAGSILVLGLLLFLGKKRIKHALKIFRMKQKIRQIVQRRQT